jgi:cytochrome b pre-mRNA-processing protein 3
MILGLFRRSANDDVIARLYGAIVDASRQRGLYADLAVPDTFEGRFESLTLHAVIVLRRLQAGPAPGPDMAQHLVDTIFKHFDRALREMGVGDTVVPKRMKKMAEAFLGRSAAYDAALRPCEAEPETQDALPEALSRNVYVGRHDGVALADYVRASIDRFARLPLQTFVDGATPFPDPAAYVGMIAAEDRISP